MNPPLDNDRKNDVCLVLALGGTMKVAAEYVGCSERTLYNTARRDPEFKKRIRRAGADIELGCLKTVKKASHDDQNWRAAVQLLKYLDADRYARKANTLPVKNAEKFMSEFTRLMISLVDDPAIIQKLDECFNHTKRSLRNDKNPKPSTGEHLPEP